MAKKSDSKKVSLATEEKDIPSEEVKKTDFGTYLGNRVINKQTKKVNNKEYQELTLSNGIVYLLKETDPEFKEFYKA